MLGKLGAIPRPQTSGCYLAGVPGAKPQAFPWIGKSKVSMRLSLKIVVWLKYVWTYVYIYIHIHTRICTQTRMCSIYIYSWEIIKHIWDLGFGMLLDIEPTIWYLCVCVWKWYPEIAAYQKDESLSFHSWRNLFSDKPDVTNKRVDVSVTRYLFWDDISGLLDVNNQQVWNK